MYLLDPHVSSGKLADNMKVPIAHPDLVDYDTAAWTRIEAEGLGGFTGVTPVSRDIFGDATTSDATSSAGPRPLQLPVPLAKRIPPKEKHEWHSVDCNFGGAELRRWAGVEYQSQGGQEVGAMVRSLWDERGWECLWVSCPVCGSGNTGRAAKLTSKFVNPPRLQSVPGFSHFHVFARRKTPEEINASEMVWGPLAWSH
jgi:hypothetical protein